MKRERGRLSKEMKDRHGHTKRVKVDENEPWTGRSNTVH